MIKGVESIVLVPLGGLCNRLRAMFSTIKMARDCNVPLQIVWLRDAGLNARFSDLFVPFSGDHDISVTIHDSCAWYRYGVSRRRNLFLPALWQSLAFNAVLTEANLASLTGKSLSDASLSATIRNQLSGRVLIQTGLGFYPCNDGELFRLLEPSPEVRLLIEARQKMITPHTVGLHIRRADNVQSITHSPLKAFEEVMEKHLQRDSHTRFYIASDDSSVISSLASRFPSCTWTESTPTRSTVIGMQEAVAELYTLIACPRFYGSYWSSFSDMVVACHQEGQAGIIYVKE